MLKLSRNIIEGNSTTSKKTGCVEVKLARYVGTPTSSDHGHTDELEPAGVPSQNPKQYLVGQRADWPRRRDRNCSVQEMRWTLERPEQEPTKIESRTPDLKHIDRGKHFDDAVVDELISFTVNGRTTFELSTPVSPTW